MFLLCHCFNKKLKLLQPCSVMFKLAGYLISAWTTLNGWSMNATERLDLVQFLKSLRPRPHCVRIKIKYLRQMWESDLLVYKKHVYWKKNIHCAKEIFNLTSLTWSLSAHFTPLEQILHKNFGTSEAVQVSILIPIRAKTDPLSHWGICTV